MILVPPDCTYRKVGTVGLRHNPQWAVVSHGWPLLRPFEVAEKRLSWVLKLEGMRRVQVRWSGHTWRLSVWTDGPALNSAGAAEVRRVVAWMFRKEEQFDEFWDLCAQEQSLRKCRELGMGALVRSPTVFEDIVKTMCTLNCHWRNTEQMVERLCMVFGELYVPGDGRAKLYTFPTVERIASASEKSLKATGLGFRWKYVRELSRSVVSGRVNLDRWRAEQDTNRLRSELLEIAGVGPYAASHIMMLLGHYEYVPCDSVVCAHVGLPPRTRPKKVEHEVAKRYKAWGKYQFLAYKCERVLERRKRVT